MGVEAPDTLNLLEVPVGDLKPGMYVAALDRPWLGTPFLMQGFVVRDQAEIDSVAEHAAIVYVDPGRQSREKYPEAKPQARKPKYREQTSLKQEYKAAQVDLTSASKTIENVFAQLKNGGKIDVGAVQTAINPLIDSVLRNSEAMASLVRMRLKGDYLYNHSLTVSVWAAIFGRYLGFDRTRLTSLALGGALIDTGMATVPDEIILATGPLTPDQMTVVRKHVDDGVAHLRKSHQVDQDVIGMVATHHERHDGSGYPRGLEGVDIPVFGRIAGMIDSYDAMITTRPHAKPRSSFQAMREIANLKNKKFQGELVEQFMQAIGLFPTGSVVELNSGEIGVVVQQNTTRRLRPKVIVVLDAEGDKQENLVVLDLSKYDKEGNSESDLWIAHELQPGAHGIQPNEYFL